MSTQPSEMPEIKGLLELEADLEYEVEESEEEGEDTLVVRRLKGIRPNPIYHLLQDDAKNYEEQFTLCSTNNNNAIMIFLTPMHTALYDKYYLLDSHVTFYKNYAPIKTRRGYSGCALGHLTEVWGRGNNILTKHTYFNENGQVAYTQVNNASFKESPLYYYEDLLKANVQSASALLQELISSKNQCLKELMTESQKLDTQLAKAFDNLINNDDPALQADFRSQYLETAHRFTETVQKINSYANFVDKRGVFIEVVCARLDQLISSKVKALSREIDAAIAIEDKFFNESSEVAEEQAPSAPKPEIVVVDGLKQLDRDFTTLQQTILSLENNSTEYAQKLVEQHELVQKIEEEILAIYFMPNMELTPHHKHLIRGLEAKIKKIKLLGTLFEEHCLAGHLEIIQVVAPFIADRTIYSVSLNLIEKLIRSKKEALNSKLIDVCDWLCANTNGYKVAICECEMAGYSGTIFGRSFAESPNAQSYLYRAYSQKNLKAFEMLLRHGVSPMGYGIIREGVVIPQLAALVMNGEDDGIPFVKSLFAHGCDDAMTLYKVQLCCSTPPRIKSTLELPKRFAKDLPELQKYLSKMDSALEYYLFHIEQKLKSEQTALLLVEHTNDLTALLTVCGIILEGGGLGGSVQAARVPVNPSHSGLYMLTSKKAAIQVAQQYSEDKETGERYMFFVNNNDPKLISFITALINKINQRYQDIMAKSPQQIELLRKKLYKAALSGEEVSECLWDRQLGLCAAAQLMFCLKEQHTVEDKQCLMELMLAQSLFISKEKIITKTNTQASWLLNMVGNVFSEQLGASNECILARQFLRLSQEADPVLMRKCSRDLFKKFTEKKHPSWAAEEARNRVPLIERAPRRDTILPQLLNESKRTPTLRQLAQISSSSSSSSLSCTLSRGSSSTSSATVRSPH